jgi:nucleotide-binding universal stress UspA family protein
MRGANMEESGELKFNPQRKILIATDGSETANEAADFGIETLKFSGAKVYAVYVIETTSYGSASEDEKWSKKTEQFQEIGRGATSYVEEKAKAAGLEAESILLKGNPAEEILDFAEGQDVDMIVMGSLGKTGIKRVVLGSVSEKVVRHAKVPVLVVRERKEEKTHKKILIATDGSDAAQNAADYGIEIARWNGAKVYAVYVIDITSFYSIIMDEVWVKNTYEQLEKIGRKATSDLEEDAKAAGIEAESIVLKGNPAKEILDFAEKQKVDMIVVGSIGKSGVQSFLLGGTAGKVSRNSKIPVLVVREIFKFPKYFSRSQRGEKVPTEVVSEEKE